MHTNGDVDARTLLSTAYGQLQQSVKKLTDPNLIRYFWQAPAHRQLRESWRKM
jgi:hypothetical protein